MATDIKMLNMALRSVGGKEAFIKKHQLYRQNVIYIDNNRSQLLKKYNENWIAVYGEEVVAFGAEYREVVKRINKLHIPIEEVVIKFLSSQKMLTLF